MRAARVGLLASWMVCMAGVGASPVLGQRANVDLPPEDRVLTANFDEVFRVGEEDGERLTDVTSLGFDSDGNIMIGDFGRRTGLRIIVVSSTGELLARWGRRGEGPGEFRGLALQIYPLDDGRVAVPDPGHGAYHLFTSRGKLERMVRIPGARMDPVAMSGSEEVREMIPDRAGSLLSRITKVSRGVVNKVHHVRPANRDGGTAGGTTVATDKGRCGLRNGS